MSAAELENVITTVRAIKGARLQEVQTSESDLALGFYFDGQLVWVWIDLTAVRPSLIPWTQLPLKTKAHKSPLHLFLRAHFVGRSLADVVIEVERGRVVRLDFGTGGPDDPSLEVRLVPHVRNVLATAAGKRIAWQKPRELGADVGPEYRRPARTLDQLREEWRNARGATARNKTAAVDPTRDLEAKAERLGRARAKVTEELARKGQLPWTEVGNWLKAHQSIDVPAEWEPFVDRRRNLSWNIERAFAKARELAAKTVGTEKRLHLLDEQLDALRVELNKPAADRRAPEAPKSNPLGGAGAAKGRTLRLDRDLTVVAGKSAADNLKLLRRARAWDLWIHLRDYPSSHAILFRNKNQSVNDADLLEVASWFVKLHLGHKMTSGARYEVLIAECRFVRPIKGDKIGRVTYRDERTLIFRAP